VGGREVMRRRSCSIFMSGEEERWEKESVGREPRKEGKGKGRVSFARERGSVRPRLNERRAHSRGIELQ